MNDYLAAEDRALLEQHGLASFDALWALQLEPVDEPNTERGGYSTVCRLELDGHAYYLKRQTNHLTRSLAHPLGEPTFARELRNIRRYRELGIPALEAAFFAARKRPGESCAILLTRALDGWSDLFKLLEGWDALTALQRRNIILACGQLAARLHAAGQLHGCFYPKHIFLRPQAEGYQACLIDLEKTRPLWFGRRDRIKDLEPLLRRANAWTEDEVHLFLVTYLDGEAGVDSWMDRLGARQREKDGRR
jgi:tRNA A-37 threonylcarbamoyl transferase component Bud32